nr:hypothetical protein [Clostridia bacterium]
KGILVPWLPGALYYREGYGNTRGFMTDVVTRIANVRPVADTSPMLEITLGVKADGGMALVQFVNNSGHFGTSYVEPLPVPDVKATVPCARQAREAVSLVSGRLVPFTQADGRITLSVGAVEEFESIRITLDGT